MTEPLNPEWRHRPEIGVVLETMTEVEWDFCQQCFEAWPCPAERMRLRAEELDRQLVNAGIGLVKAWRRSERAEEEATRRQWVEKHDWRECSDPDHDDIRRFLATLDRERAGPSVRCGGCGVDLSTWPTNATGHVCAALRATDTPSLDAAWKAAEEALPEGWSLHGVRRGYVGAAATANGPAWSATAQLAGIGVEQRRHGTVPNKTGTGPTPAAALLALAARLRESHPVAEPERKA